MESPSQSSQAQLCRNGCGFYGSPKNDGMCSLCYKEYIQKKNTSDRKTPSLSSINPKDVSNSSALSSDGSSVASAMASLATSDTPSTAKVTSEVSSTSSSSASIPSATDPNTALTSHSPQTSNVDEASTSVDSTSPSPSKPKKNRCASCRKRLGLTGFYCRCGNIYCSLHRYSDQHACQFDYKADAQAKIRKENPVVVGEKINKI